MAHYFLGMVALVFPRLDSCTAVTDAVLNVPVVTDLKEDVVNLIRIGGRASHTTGDHTARYSF
jgi:hypothetical protein